MEVLHFVTHNTAITLQAAVQPTGAPIRCAAGRGKCCSGRKPPRPALQPRDDRRLPGSYNPLVAPLPAGRARRRGAAPQGLGRGKVGPPPGPRALQACLQVCELRFIGLHAPPAALRCGDC